MSKPETTTPAAAGEMKNEPRELTLCTYHFPENDNRFNGRRTAIYVGKGPKYVSLVVMDAAELTITRIALADAEKGIKYLTAEQADPEKALTMFRETARSVGCTKPVAEVLGIEWPPVMASKAQESFEARAEKDGARAQVAANQAAREEKRAERQREKEAREQAKAKKEQERQAQLAADEAAKAERRANKPEGKIAVIRRVIAEKAETMFGADTRLCDLTREQSTSLIKDVRAALPEQNEATIKTQYARVRAISKGLAA